MIPNSFKALKTHEKVCDISYEPEQSYKEFNQETEKEYEAGRIYWVFLNSGWCYDEIGRHSLNGSTITEVKNNLKTVFSCSCEHCKSSN